MTDYRNQLNIRRGQAQQLQKTVRSTRHQLLAAEHRVETAEKAQLIIQEVARMTQEQLQYHVSELVTLALTSVFEEPYEFEVEFVTSRKQTEVNLWFVKDGERFHPLSATGGGVVDVAALALRISLWAIQSPRTRNVLILDEPLRHLSRYYLVKASEMISALAKKTGIQIIMIAHPPELIEAADRVIEVTMKKGVSEVCSV